MVNNGKEIRISSFDNILDQIQNFNYNPSGDVSFIIKRPIDAYIREILPLRIKDNIRQKRITDILKKFNDKYDKDTSISEEIDRDRLKEILDEFNSKGNFYFLKPKDRKALLKSNIFWIGNEYRNYHDPFIKYIQSEDKYFICFKHILQLYIRQYSILKKYGKFKDFFQNMHRKYITNKKSVPEYIQNIFNDCNLLSGNAENELSNKCLNEKRNNNKNIVDILLEQYKLIKPHTSLFDEIIIKICDICKNRIHDEFFFKLLFDEVLDSEIDGKQSGIIVSNIITLFGKDKNTPVANLEKIKSALIKNRYYGDPRISGATSYWRYVEENAKHIFITWLAQADLEFFFNIAFKNMPDPHNRKQFWQKYINSRQLVESHVIWGQTYYNLPEIKREQEKSGVKYKYFVNENECCCFILKFNNIYIVEFSEINNAVYFYSNDEFNKRINIQKRNYYNTEVLKRKGPYTCQFSKKDNNKVPALSYCGSFNIYHSGAPGTWENLADTALAEYGVGRGDRYGFY